MLTSLIWNCYSSWFVRAKLCLLGLKANFTKIFSTNITYINFFVTAPNGIRVNKIWWLIIAWLLAVCSIRNCFPYSNCIWEIYGYTPTFTNPHRTQQQQEQQKLEKNRVHCEANFWLEHIICLNLVFRLLDLTDPATPSRGPTTTWLVEPCPKVAL